MRTLIASLLTLAMLTACGVRDGTAPAQLTPTVANYLPVVVVPLPTLTPTTAPTITPSPTQAPVGVFVLDNHSTYVDSINYLHIVGEVVNNTNTTTRFVRISVDIYTTAGQLVATDSTYTEIDNLAAHDRGCFDVSLQQPAGWASYRFEPVTYSVSSALLPSLTQIGVSGSYDVSDRSYRVLGEVHNDGATRVTFVEPIGTLYDGAGMVVGCDFTFVNSTDLDPGQQSAFEIRFSGRDEGDVVLYRIQVDGNVQ